MTTNNIEEKCKSLHDFFSVRVEQIIDWENLEKKVKSGKKILIKYGADPSKPDLHLGHGVCLRLMRKMQDEWDAQVQFLIGDFTGRIGDPSGKSKAREVLGADKVKENALSYAKQVFMILDESKTEIWSNGSKLDFISDCRGGWWDQMSLSEFLSLLTMVTHAKLIDRDMFQERIKNGQEIYMHEMMYPILQGYDSVKMESDLTIVGSDQLFNELMGRFFQERFEQIPQTIITAPILVGLDGRAKMSKSLNNYISLTDSAEEMFGKTMSIPDDIIVNWVKLLSNLDYALIEERLKKGENPRDVKMDLASDIVAQFHGKEMAEAAQDNFINVFSNKENPENILEINLDGDSYDLLEIMKTNNLVSSKSDARRMIKQGAVKLNDEKILDADYIYKPNGEDILKVGKRKYLRIRHGK
ncbi:MAG TPA: tyrosine--tRNA ligase [bacterium]|nr:tyrosine--tRNA ligase [bacterium]